MPRLLTVLMALLLSARASADAIDDYVRDQMRGLHLPGIALAVVRDGDVVTIRTYGSANLELNAPVSEETVFELGSVTKQFTAAAIMVLVEDGKVRLDDRIIKHLPELPASWRDITVRHLLTHSSGIQEYLAVPALPDQAHALEHRQMTRLFGERLKREFAPGQTWAYSNSGYLLLGDIIERVSGRSYWDVLRERIFAPAGMSATRSSAPRAVIRNRAAGYGWREGEYENRGALSENAFAAGSIVSTIRDMTRWDAALKKRQSSHEQMWTPLGVPRADAAVQLCLRLGRRSRARASGRVSQRRHARLLLRRYVDHGLTVIVLANLGDRVLDHIPMEIAGIVDPALARQHAAEDPDPARSRMLLATLRDLLRGGKYDPESFTPAMQLFLTTSTGRGLWEWIASHGELKSLTYAQTDGATHRYRAEVGDARLWFSFTLTGEGKIAQIYWW